MTAKEMFEKLGYELDIDVLGIIRYAKHDIETGLAYYIRFLKDEKVFNCNTISYNEIYPLHIDIELHEAINKQCKELGWE